MKKILLALLLFFNLAATAQRTGKDYALFFVVNDFDHWADLPGIDKDLREISTELENSYGFQKPDFYLNPRMADILKVLTDYQSRSFGSDDQLLVFFSMHGYYDEAIGALIPKDGLLDDPGYQTWLLHPALEAMLTKIKCQHILLSLDACYSGTFGQKYKDRPKSPAWESESNDCAAKCKRALQHKSRLYLTSGGKERTPTNSQFARKWLEALRLRNEDGLLSFPKLYSVLAEAYPQPMYGDFKDNAVGGDFVLVKKGCATPPSSPTNGAADQDKAQWRQAQTTNTLAAYRQYLRDCGLCLYSEDAESAITRLKPATPTERGTDLAENTPKSGDLMPDGMVFVKGGKFQMGSPSTEPDRSSDEQQHQVELSDFYIGKYEVTQKQWRKVMGSDPPELYFKNCDNCPVEGISWYDVQDFIRKLNQQTWGRYRLPTEAEWEYAAKGGNKTNRFTFAGTADKNELDKYANFCDKNCEYSLKTASANDRYKNTSPVGKFLPNELGLHDMTGNVYEWCSDLYGWDYYESSPLKNPTGSINSDLDRVVRGGSWNTGPDGCRVADRNGNEPRDRFSFIGFRLAKSK